MKRSTISVASLCAALTCTTSTFATIVYEDGGIHTFNTTTTESIVVDNDTNAPNGPTHLTIDAGAVIGDDSPQGVDTSVLAVGNSTIIINGGTIEQDVDAWDDSTITMNGGIVEDDLYSHDFATFNLTGGVVADDVNVRGDSLFSMFGGTVGEDFEAGQDSTAFIYGGSISREIVAFQGASITISGGTIGISNDAFLSTDFISSITLDGSNFKIDGVAISLGDIAPTTGILSGNLADGSAFEIDFKRIEVTFDGTTSTGTITLIPEPASFALLSLGSLLFLSRKNK
ncbi:hypothetical protein KS4_35880 [Poriferisphaera corsica]|uniref:PEP-CTERM protein-sorting domain-containing protein n=1 Tax=Poriferisphaera corsica TaxID=2528020 RepID=A0A517YZ58_9BACT|nr:PEP-CTERM sorting domain-containing protein [Poriferisphaera corsica]QDU35505.1 hypothetical protein KS4_35880 [Poriferisphaera corsica]